MNITCALFVLCILAAGICQAQIAPFSHIPLPQDIGVCRYGRIGNGFVVATHGPATGVIPEGKGRSYRDTNRISYDNGRTWVDVFDQDPGCRISVLNDTVLACSGYSSMTFVHARTRKPLLTMDDLQTNYRGVLAERYGNAKAVILDYRSSQPVDTNIYVVDLVRWSFEKHAMPVHTTTLPRGNGRWFFLAVDSVWVRTQGFIAYDTLAAPTARGNVTVTATTDILWATKDSTYRSTDDGRTWMREPRVKYPDNTVFDGRGRRIGIEQVPLPGDGIACYVYDDATKTKLWHLPRVLSTYGVTCTDKGHWLVVSPIGMFVSTNDGATWTACSEPNASRYPIDHLSVLPDGRVVVMGYQRPPLISDASMTSWQPIVLRSPNGSRSDPHWFGMAGNRLVGIGSYGALISEQYGQMIVDFSLADKNGTSPSVRWYAVQSGDSLLLSTNMIDTYVWKNEAWPDTTHRLDAGGMYSMYRRLADGSVHLGGAVESQLIADVDGTVRNRHLQNSLFHSGTCSSVTPVIRALVEDDTSYTILATDALQSFDLTTIYGGNSGVAGYCFELLKICTDGRPGSGYPELVSANNWSNGVAPYGRPRGIVNIDARMNLLFTWPEEGSTTTMLGLLRNRLDTAEWLPAIGCEGSILTMMCDTLRHRLIAVTEKGIYSSGYVPTSVREDVPSMHPLLFDYTTVCDVQGRVLSARRELPAWDALPAGSYGITYMNEGRVVGHAWVVSDGTRLTGYGR